MNAESYDAFPITSRQLKAMLVDKLAYREHWLFLPSAQGLPTLYEIQAKFYPNALASDFSLVDWGECGFAIAHKRHLSAPTLAGFLRKYLRGPQFDARPLTGVDLMQQQVICLADQQEAALLLKAFRQWLGDAIGGTGNDGTGH